MDGEILEKAKHEKGGRGEGQRDEFDIYVVEA